MKRSKVVALAALTLFAACGGDKSGSQVDKPTPAGMEGMPGMEGDMNAGKGMQSAGGMNGMNGMDGMMQGGGMQDMSAGMQDMSAGMQAHMASMMGNMNSAQMMDSLPAHRQMVANMMAGMNAEMRGMNMTADADWNALVDSLRQDLVRMPEMSGSALKEAMPDHAKRVERLTAMHQRMMSAMKR